LKLSFGVETLQDDGLEDARGDTEIDRFPAVVFADGGVEFDLDGEFAIAIEFEDETVRLGANAPLGGGGGFGGGGGAFRGGEGGGAFEEGEGAAFGSGDMGGGGQDEGGLVAGELAGELEILQSDVRRGRRCRRWQLVLIGGNGESQRKTKQNDGGSHNM